MAKRFLDRPGVTHLAAALALSGACNTLTGVNDLEVEEEYNQPGSGGTPGAFGANGGSGGAGGVSGSGGGAGSSGGGGAGSGGAGGGGGAAGSGGMGGGGSGGMGGSGGSGGTGGSGGSGGTGGSGGSGGQPVSGDINSLTAQLLDELSLQNQIACECFEAIGYASRDECLNDFTLPTAECASAAFNLNPGASALHLACLNPAEIVYTDCTADLSCIELDGTQGDACFDAYATVTDGCPVLPDAIVSALSACPVVIPGPGGCSNTCAFPDDAECDDGGPGSETNFCAFGTDCGDCGPR
jgi:hypothetical protein